MTGAETPHVPLEELALHTEGLLPTGRAATVTAHVATCPSCRTQQGQLAGVRSVLAADDAGPMAAAASAAVLVGGAALGLSALRGNETGTGATATKAGASAAAGATSSHVYTA